MCDWLESELEEYNLSFFFNELSFSNWVHISVHTVIHTVIKLNSFYVL